MLRTIRIVVFLLFFGAIIASVVALQHQHLLKIKRYRPYRDSLYMPSGKYVKLVTLGYDMLLADFLWLRAIQAFGGHFMSDQDYRPIFNFFDVITDLDPYFIDAYTFGNTVIGDEGGDVEQGLKLLDKGIIKTLNNTYKLGYWGGYICVWQVFKPILAKYYFRMALKCDDSPDFLERLLIYVDYKMGRYRIAYEKYVDLLLEAIDKNDSLLKSIGWDRVKDVINQWNISILLNAAREFAEESGRDIANLQELTESGILKQYEAPSLTSLEKSIEQYEHQGRSLHSLFQEIVKQSVIQQQGIPQSPYGTNYVIWAGRTSKDKDFIIGAKSLIENLKTVLTQVRLALEAYKKKHGNYPGQMKDLFKDWDDVPEFFGGQWLYNPETGELRSSTHPNL